MKRCLSVLLCIALIVCMSAVSFADSTRYVEDEFSGFVFSQDTSLTKIGVFLTSEMTPAVQDFLRGYWLGNSADYHYFTIFSSTSVLYIYRYPKASTISVSYDSSRNKDHFSLSPSGSFDRVGFQASGASNIITNISTVVSVAAFWSDSVIHATDPDLMPSVSPSFIVSYKGLNLAFEDDGGLASGPDPGDPDDPSSSEPPFSSVPSVIPEFPKIDSPYVPYDTSAWNDFIPFVLDYIKKAATVGLFILAIWTGIILIKKVVRMFLHWGKL